MTDTPRELLRRWTVRQSGDNRAWLEESLARLADGAPDRDLHIFLGLAPRRLGKDDLVLTPDEERDATGARVDWRPRGWSLDGAARVLGLLVHASEKSFAQRYSDLRRTADIAELIALYRGLPVYPEPESLVDEATEGVRSNMRAVFEAVAHDNPYPRDYFDERQWNQMILKSLFIDSRMAAIIGVDDRANPDLARVLRDYAHERWAAGRPVSPELWRLVGPFADDEGALADLERALSGGPAEARAAALALSVSPAAEANELLRDRPERTAIEAGTLTWDTIEEGSA